MKVKNAILSALIAACIATPLNSFATSHYMGTATVVVASTGTAEATAGYGMFKVPAGGLQSACNGWVYIAPDDKQMFAEILTAQINGLPVSFYYEDAATSRNLAVVTSTCKLTWLSRE